MATRLINGERVELTPAEEQELDQRRADDEARVLAANAALNARIRAANARVPGLLQRLGLQSLDELKEILTLAGRPEKPEA